MIFLVGINGNEQDLSFELLGELASCGVLSLKLTEIKSKVSKLIF